MRRKISDSTNQMQSSTQTHTHTHTLTNIMTIHDRTDIKSHYLNHILHISLDSLFIYEELQ